MSGKHVLVKLVTSKRVHDKVQAVRYFLECTIVLLKRGGFLYGLETFAPPNALWYFLVQPEHSAV